MSSIKYTCRISNWFFFVEGAWTSLGQFWAWKMGFFWLIVQELRDLCGTWDLYYLIVLRLQFLGKFWFFCIIFYFPGVNWAQKWAKTANFGYVLFPLKDIILKDCSYAVFVLWCSTSGPNLSTIWTFLWKLWPQNPPKWAISWMLHRHENIWTSITWEPQML